MTQPKIKTNIEARVQDIGDIMTGFIDFQNKDSYFAVTKTRNLEGTDYRLTLGIGAEGTTSLELYDMTNDPGNYLSRINLFRDKIVFIDNNKAFYTLLHTGNINEQLDGRYVNITGDTMTGNLVLSDMYYIDCKMINTQPEAHTDHAISLGHYDKNYVDFYEYGGTWNFYQSRSGANTLLASITSSGITAKAFLGNATTASELQYFLTENPSDNVAGYRLLYQGSPGTWNNARIVLSVSSRHNGNGIICIAFGCNSATVSAENIYGQIIYYGNNNNATHSTGIVYYKDMFQLYYNSTTNTISLFSKYTDYSTIKLNILNSYTTGSNDKLGTLILSNFSNGTYVSSIDTATYGNLICQTQKGWAEGDTITGAVWNDYAEYREADTIEPGYVLIEKGDDTLIKSTERLQAFAGVSSDTWGFSQGETEKAKTPIAVAGRVLVYPAEDRETYQPGDCVCAAPNGKVSKMTRQEIIEWPDRIVGKVSCVPNYEEWGGGENADREPVKVNGRIWIQVK